MSEFNLIVEEREALGKNANRRLRASGHIPAVVYGGGRDAAAIQVPAHRFARMQRQTADSNPVFLLQLAGTDKQRHVMIRELDTDPVTGDYIHIDFQRIDMNAEISVSVRLELVGESAGIKLGGISDWVTREVEILALPDAIPGHIDVDISELEIGQHLETSDLVLPEGVKLADDGNLVVVAVHGQQAEAEVEEEDGEGEPEVIAKGKAEE
ncbi:MAG: 50S ribosomal protein L25 [Acidobacteriota bacterium]